MQKGERCPWRQNRENKIFGSGDFCLFGGFLALYLV